MESTKEIGEKAVKRVMVFSDTQMVLHMKGVGSTTRNTDLVMKNGLMAPLMRVNTPKVSRKAKAPSEAQMVQYTRALLSITNSVAPVPTNGALGVSILVIGSEI